MFDYSKSREVANHGFLGVVHLPVSLHFPEILPDQVICSLIEQIQAAQKTMKMVILVVLTLSANVEKLAIQLSVILMRMISVSFKEFSLVWSSTHAAKTKVDPSLTTFWKIA